MLAEVEATGDHADRPVAVWLEDRDGTIVRGVAESVTAGGARVFLSGEVDLDAGEAVALRICFEPGRPTVAASARVSWIRSGGDRTECGLEWTEP
jgi:hypothetical protein